MAVALADRDRLFKSFARAWFKQDMAALYEVVTPEFEWRTAQPGGAAKIIVGGPAILEEMAAMRTRAADIRFTDVVYHHLPDVSFMTFRMIETDPGTGARREHVGIERYAFRDGRIAVKDVFRKPA